MIPFLHLGWLTIPTYGLMVALAMLAAYLTLRADLARRGIAPKSSSVAETLIAVPCLVGLIGAKLYHELESPREFFADPWHQLFSQYGFAWFGGLLAGFAAYVWLARKQPAPLLTMLDAGSPAAALGYGVGRIGCLLSGDGDYGIPTSLPWGMSFPNGLVPTAASVHPTPIYEFIVACLIARLLWKMGAADAITRRGTTSFHATTDTASLRDRRGTPCRAPTDQNAGAADTMSDKGTAGTDDRCCAGEVFAAYLLLTGVARFLVEFIRINPRSFLGMTNAQAASLASILAGAAVWWIRKKDSARR